MKELFTSYEAFPDFAGQVSDPAYQVGEGKRAHLQPTRPFREHVEWLQHFDFTQGQSYWQDLLKGFIAPTPFLVDQKGLTQATSHGTQQLALSIALTSALRTLAEEHQLTLHTMLQGAWALLLSRYSGETTVVFGNVRAGRWNSVEGADSMVGLFINTLPMRVNVDPDMSLLSYLQAVRAQHLALREPLHEYSPLVQIQQWSEVPSEMPLFESILAYERYTINQMLQAATQRQHEFELFEQVSSPLRVNAYGGYGSSGLMIKIGYDKPRFDDATISRMLGHFHTLLEGMIAKAPLAQNIGHLPILTELERHQLLVEWNPTVFYPPRHAIHELFEAQVNRQPDAIALSYPTDNSSITLRRKRVVRLTYRELNERANQLAHYLQALGVAPNRLVGLCMERSIEMVIAFLAILKAGGAYVPLDPVYPVERLDFMVQDTQMDIVVTQEAFVDLFDAAGGGLRHQDRVKLVSLDGQAQRVIAHQSKENPISEVTPDNLAYIIYTSGSTGKPKGVLVNHYNVVRLFEGTEQWYGFDENDVWTLFHSYAFDFSVWELWGALIYGGRLVVIPYQASRSPEAFYKLLLREQVTVLNQTPSAFRQLIQAEEAIFGEGAAIVVTTSLRYVIFGGEALELQSLRPWFERHGDQKPQLVNMYGITETTVHVTYRPISLDDLANVGEKSVIGHPIPDLELYILDQNRQPVPIGVTGEMYVGGAGVSLGYLNRPELTEDRFIRHPFSDNKNARLYKSGDLARFLTNKAYADAGRDVEYQGRIDHQVKIRGFRIELGEIEATLAQHQAVQEVAVIAQENPAGGGKRLLAYLVLKQPSAPTISEWHSVLSQTLPDYMVPAAFIVLDKFPLTNNGKLDYRALPQPESERPTLRNHYARPRTPTEQAMAQIWQAALLVNNVGVDDSFFELGGNSILAVRVIGQLRQHFNSDLPIHKLFELPTIRTLAEHIDAKQQALQRLAGQTRSAFEERAQRRNATIRKRRARMRVRRG
jgi:amino acid adenylation domain-containing protein